MHSKIAGLIPKTTHECLVDALIRTRPTKSTAAGDTTLLCYGAMDIAGGSKLRRLSGKRVIESVLRRNGVSNQKRARFVTLIENAKREQVAKYCLELKPYRETATWLRNEE